MTVAGRHFLDAGNTFFFGFVCQHRAADDVADRVDTSSRCLISGIDLNEATLVSLHSGFRQPKIVRTRLATDSNEHSITCNRLSTFHCDGTGLAGGCDGRDFRSELERQALLFKYLLRFVGNLFINARQDARQIFQNSHLRTQPTPDSSKFQPNHAGADDNEVLGDFRPRDGFRAGTDAISVRLNTRERRRYTACGDQNLLAGDGCR